MTYAAEHKLYPKRCDLPQSADTIMVFMPLHFDQIISVLKIPIEELRDLNPQYRRDVIPADANTGYALMLSAEQSLQFAFWEDSIYNYKRQEYFPDNRLVVHPSDTKYAATPPTGRAAINYTVKSGDVLGSIAGWFNVKVSDLKYWNDISGNNIKAGQRLVIYVPKNKEEHYKMIAQARSGKTAGKQPNKQTNEPTQKQPAGNVKYEYYEVKNGDTLWSIAQKFPGVSDEDILKLNNITNAKKIQPGQKLKIRIIS
jgi:membrane-bound lytic murein transglycosylase D